MLRRSSSPRPAAPELPPDPMLESFGRFLVVVFPLVGMFVTALVGGICGVVVAGAIATIAVQAVGEFALNSDGGIPDSNILSLIPPSEITWFGGGVGVCCGILIGIVILLTMAWWTISLRDNTFILLRSVKCMVLGAWAWELPLLALVFVFNLSGITHVLIVAAPISMILGGIGGGFLQRSDLATVSSPDSK